MICIGPVCLPVWQLGIVGAFLLKPLKDTAVYVYSRCCKHRAHCIYLGAQKLSDGHLQLFRESDTDMKIRGVEQPAHVLAVHSDDELTALRDRLNEPNRQNILFVDFGATWCQPCKAIFPFFEALSAFYEGTFVKVDVDECPESADEATVQALPTLCVMSCSEGKWEVIARTVGANKRDWENLVATHSRPRHGSGPSPQEEGESAKDR
ncbi:thioredoxin domain-containing protein [Besnoitia besnoiti]|uniref:Thioredoxin domain-containing protein n=1 Tax=Besnoitia besnoiti TaxID=94643 RepID=A0A2A9ME18_BESBE|nr:thioredoxin domain-containing protein [Besnoitia besnoiti]PFH36758.1 thioredoxin domain-containing protein [Besnoitia besnoiti]